MSLVSTLAKVALGMAIAKGVSHVSKNGLPTGGTTAATPNAGTGRSYSPQSSGGLPGGLPGGLSDMMGSILGGDTAKTTSTANQGGLGGLLEQLAGQSGAKRPTTSRKAPPSGLEDLLGSLTGKSRSGGAQTAGGSLGGLLGGLLGAAGSSATGGAAGGIGGLGGMLNDVMSGRQPAQAPNRNQEAAAALMLKAMVQAAKSDGKLDAAEKQKLMESLGEADAQEIAFVNQLLSEPVDIEALVDDVPRGLEEQVYLMSLMAINLDSQTEAQYLHNLAQALGLDQPLTNQIHDQAGAPRLYS